MKKKPHPIPHQILERCAVLRERAYQEFKWLSEPSSSTLLSVENQVIAELKFFQRVLSHEHKTVPASPLKLEIIYFSKVLCGLLQESQHKIFYQMQNDCYHVLECLSQGETNSSIFLSVLNCMLEFSSKDSNNLIIYMNFIHTIAKACVRNFDKAVEDYQQQLTNSVHRLTERIFDTLLDMQKFTPEAIRLMSLILIKYSLWMTGLFEKMPHLIARKNYFMGLLSSLWPMLDKIEFPQESCLEILKLTTPFNQSIEYCKKDHQIVEFLIKIIAKFKPARIDMDKNNFAEVSSEIEKLSSALASSIGSDEKKIQPTTEPQRICNKKMVELFNDLVEKIHERTLKPKKIKGKNNQVPSARLDVSATRLMLKTWSKEKGDFYVPLNQIVLICEFFISAVEFFFENKKYTGIISELETCIFNSIDNIYTLFDRHSDLYSIYFRAKYYQALRSFCQLEKVVNFSNILEAMNKVFILKSDQPYHCFIKLSSLNMLMISCVNFLSQEKQQFLEYQQTKPFLTNILTFSDRVIFLYSRLPKDFYQKNSQFNEKLVYWKIIFNSIRGIILYYKRIPLKEEKNFKEDVSVLLLKLENLIAENQSLLLLQQQYCELLEVIKRFLLAYPQESRAFARQALIKISDKLVSPLTSNEICSYITCFKDYEESLRLKRAIQSSETLLASQPMLLKTQLTDVEKEEKNVVPTVDKMLKIKDDQIKEAVESKREVRNQLKISKNHLKKKDKQLEDLKNQLATAREELLAERQKNQQMEKTVLDKERELKSLKEQHLATTRGELILQKQRQQKELADRVAFQQGMAERVSAYEQVITQLKLQLKGIKKVRANEINSVNEYYQDEIKKLQQNWAAMWKSKSKRLRKKRERVMSLEQTVAEQKERIFDQYYRFQRREQEIKIEQAESARQIASLQAQLQQLQMQGVEQRAWRPNFAFVPVDIRMVMPMSNFSVATSSSDSSTLLGSASVFGAPRV